MYTESPIVSEELLERLTEAVYASEGKDFHNKSFYLYKEHITKDAAMEMMRGAAWLACAENPDLTEVEDLLGIAIAKTWELSDFKTIMEEQKHRHNRKRGIAKKFTNTFFTFFGGKSSGFERVDERGIDYKYSFPIAPDETPYEEVEYEETHAGLTKEVLLVRLIEAGIDVCFAYVIVLHYTGMSVPSILEVLGYSEDDMDPKDFNTMRHRLAGLIGAPFRDSGAAEALFRRALTDEELRVIRRTFGAESPAL